MKSALPSIVFLGTPDFACPTLTTLVERGARIELVVTQPDKPRGRGRRPAPPPVKTCALERGLELYQPETIGRPEVVRRLLDSGAQCLVLVAYGQILPEALVRGFSLGAVNVHPSLLPRYRGAAPIQRCLLAGDTETGVSIMLMDRGMDTGPVLSRKKTSIAATDNFGTLHDKLARLGAELLADTLEQWAAGAIEPTAQNDAEAVPAPPIERSELQFDWERPADQIVNVIRAFDPWPGAYFVFNDKRIKCFQARLYHWPHGGQPGQVLGTGEAGLIVAAGDGRAVAVGSLQLPGKRRLAAADFLRGYPLPAGTRLTQEALS